MNDEESEASAPQEDSSPRPSPPSGRDGGEAPPSPERGKWRIAIAVFLAVLIAVAVFAVRSRTGGDDEGGDQDPLIAYCATLVERDAIRLPEAGPEPSEEVRNQVAVTAGRLILLSERMLETAPAGAEEPLRAQIEVYRELVRTRDPAGFKSDELLEARNDANDENLEACEMNQLEFSAVEYRYNDVPQAVRHGRLLLTMNNEGEEAHEMLLYRRNADSQGEFAEVLQEGGQDTQAALVTGVQVAPGASYTFAANVAGGRYAMVCALRTGNQPHWERGMVTEFEVQ